MGHPGPAGKEIEINSLYMTIGGKAVLPVMGEFHFSRYDHRYWRENLLKIKASGIDIVSTYALWIYHEELEGQLDWTGNNNLRKFVNLCKEVGLLVHLRIGPYCNAECRNGGLPDWLMAKKYIRKRYNDPLYLEYVRNWYQALFHQVDGLFYKEGGPLMGIQLENEYVTKGHVVEHLTTLKKMAVEIGFDVPVYSMTHWMASDYPKKEILPYAGYYIETPWTRGYGELPVSNFQFFSYNRLSDNIGTDLITIEGGVQSLNSNEVESPYFTCEVGLGTPTFYRRRPVVPESMAGANINLRLGCGVNLMGYYMYSGGSHRVGQLSTMQSSTSRVSYDYQAPLKEFGTLGDVMNETKKFNYLMNDFGEVLAPTIAYLPESNNDTTNLQWSVRSKDDSGFLFCSNYLYKKNRRAYEQVQFQLQLAGETITIPSNAVTVPDGAYFVWPFNLDIDGVKLKYSTTQPLCKIKKDGVTTWVFFQDDGIPAEYLFDNENIKKVDTKFGNASRLQSDYFVSNIQPGKESVITITHKDGKVTRILSLKETESDLVWKLSSEGHDHLIFSKAGLFVEGDDIVLFSENNQEKVEVFKGVQQRKAIYKHLDLKTDCGNKPVEAIRYRPMEQACWIETIAKGKGYLHKRVDARNLAKIVKADFKWAVSSACKVYLNDQELDNDQQNEWYIADLRGAILNGLNEIIIQGEQNQLQFIGEMVVEYENGSRRVWKTDNTWETGVDQKMPVKVLGIQGENDLPELEWEADERTAWYEILLPDDLFELEGEYRLALTFSGDRADAYLGSELISDYLYDGTPWVIGLNCFKDQLPGNKLMVKIKAFNDPNPKIYFEKEVDKKGLDTPVLKSVQFMPEYRFQISIRD
jgi:hypothetical protein